MTDAPETTTQLRDAEMTREPLPDLLRKAERLIISRSGGVKKGFYDLVLARALGDAARELDALAAEPREAPSAPKPIAWAMRDKASGTIVEVSTKPPFAPESIPLDWTREMIPLYTAPAAGGSK